MHLSPLAVGYFVVGASFRSSFFIALVSASSTPGNNIGKIHSVKKEEAPPLSHKHKHQHHPATDRSESSFSLSPLLPVKTETENNMSYASYTLKCTDVPQFDALEAAAASFRTDDKLHLRNLCNDSTRCNGLIASHDSHRRILHLDYSRQQVTGEVMELLFDLADAVNFHDRRDAMRRGARINSTEDRAVLHHVLRMPKGYDYSIYGTPGHRQSHHPYHHYNNNDAQQQHQRPPLSSFQGGGAGSGGFNTEGNMLLQKVHRVQDKIEDFSNRMRSGEIRGATGKRLKNYVCIGIGGSQLGAEFVKEAFRGDPEATKASQGRTLRFLANVDQGREHRGYKTEYPVPGGRTENVPAGNC